MTKQNQTKYERLTSQALKNISNSRTRDIISLRFGLGDGNRQTLEATGKKYGITRERVRQVEEAAFSVFREDHIVENFEPVFKSINDFLNQKGNLVKEDELFFEMTKTNYPHPKRGSLHFILTLEPSCKRFVENEDFYPFWTNSKTAYNKAKKVVSQLVKKINQEQKPLKFEDLYEYTKQQKQNFTKKTLASYLSASKKISQNTLGEYGLSKWAEINPRGARDKAYIVLKQHGAPLHFTEVAKSIHKSGLSSVPAQPQTVHNELIKDNRFILVGRGTYALEEWGYKKGIVREVIAQILKEKGPLTREEVIDEVIKNRSVKPNTILINLQNRKYFIRDQGRKYKLR